MTGLLARARFILGTIALVMLIAFAMPVHAQQNAPVDPEASVVNEQTLLQQFRRIQGDIDQPNPRERVLIQPDGRIWDHFHEVTLRWIGVVAILGTLALLAAAYFLLGRLRISAGRSGRKVPRFTGFERFSHWLTAVSFVVLGLTGLNITFGKLLLRPLIGPEAFSAFSEGAKYVHNYISFSFVVGLMLIVGMWIKDNIPDRTDIEWFRQGGGFIKSRHAPARRFNAGEKLVFWGALGAGTLVAISGFLLLFPFYVTNIFGMQIAQGVHAVIALLFVAMILGHIYIGTAGMEGAFEAMGTGEVDYNWAKEHHDLWFKEQIAKGRTGHHADLPAATPAE
ncbi:MAG: formate dehydrogenase subunit gamma [Hyphomicrobiales bacterium]|jgi:formate dehydrogenase subunit gamma|nr:formate dehydrogenase subunit gamma [Hyphomicrobiales bacterium]